MTKTKPTGHPELREHKEGRQSQSPETMHCTSQVQVLAINVAKNIYALCLLLSERWATYLASWADVCMAKAQTDRTDGEYVSQSTLYKQILQK